MIINGSQESVEGSELTTILLDIGNEAQSIIGKQNNISSSFFFVNLLFKLCKPKNYYSQFPNWSFHFI